MNEIFKRLELLIDEEGMNKLKGAHVAVFGVGGVGGYALEALARSGISEFTIFDHDTVSLSNINRQIIALHSTIDEYKVDVFEKRLKDINPEIIIHKSTNFVTKENIDEIDFSRFSFIVDCIDTVSTKILLAEIAYKNNIEIISSMGTGNKLDPSKLVITDINKTEICPLARVMRYELRKRDIKKLTVLYSTEIPIKTNLADIENSGKRSVPGSSAFVPPAAGLYIASYVVRKIIGLLE